MFLPKVWEKPKGLDVPVDIKTLRDETLSRYACSESDRPEKVSKGGEVGDDRVSFSKSVIVLATEISVQENVVDMRTSHDDTLIDELMWNFCEVTTNLPCCKENTYQQVRKTGRFDALEFIDSPPLRVVIDTTKVERIHSTSLAGKAAILANKTRTANKICRPYMELGSMLQDSFLNTWKADEPKYLPFNLGGYNAPALFNDAGNLYLSVKSYRGGGYDRVYGTATAEIMDAIRQTESGNPTYALMASVLRERDEEYFFATFKNLVMLPADQKGEDKLPIPVYKKQGIINEIASVESRLIQTKHLMTRSQALVEIARTERIDHVLTTLNDVGVMKTLVKESLHQKRLEVLGATRANSAFRNLLARTATEKDVSSLFSEGWQQVFLGQREFNLNHAKWIQRGAKGEYLTILDMPSSEDMFLRSEVSKEETLRVEGLFISPDIPKPGVYTEARVGLWQVSSSMEEWADNIAYQLLEKRNQLGRPLDRLELLEIYHVDREWVNDDSLIIADVKERTARCARTSDVALISQDVKLAKRLARTCNLRVILCEPEKAYNHFPGRVWNSKTQITTQEFYLALEKQYRILNSVQEPACVVIDTGSMESALAKLVLRKRKSAFEIIKREVVDFGVDDHKRRYAKLHERKILVEPKLTPTGLFVPPGSPMRGKSTHSYSSPGTSQGGLSDITWSEFSTRRRLRFEASVQTRDSSTGTHN